jgi:3-oxoacyl-[acyl-carrier protein] reductase
MASEFNLKDKVVIVTGSSRGIGSSIAKRFSEEGSKVIITYLKNKTLAQKIQKSLSTESIILQCDVTKNNSVDRLVKLVLKKFKRIDILVNNAGAIFEPAAWDKISPKNWNKTIASNLTGTFNCLQKIAPLMLKQKEGKIINISSTISLCPSTYAIAYSVAKAGIINLTQAFAKELAPYVNVNSIAPGWTDTDWHNCQDKFFMKRVKNSVPFKRLAKTDEIASAVIFLASNQANFITGQNLIIDGGATLK